MIDSLNCLREYVIYKKPIVEKNNFIFFGEHCWPKSVKTNYRVFNREQDAAKEYYTLECLIFLLNNLKLSHVAYVNLARKNDVPFIRRPDRKKLLAYLKGEISTSPSIDTSAPVVYATKVKPELQKEISDVIRDSNFQNSSAMSSCEAGISESNSQSSFNHNCIPAAVKLEKEEQEEINRKPSSKELSVITSTEVAFSKNEEKKISGQTVQQEDYEKRNKKPRIEELSVITSTEVSFSKNEEQFFSGQTVKQEEDYEKRNKNPRIENSFTPSSNEASISRNENQRYFNHDHNSITVKREVEDQDEIDIKPSKEELALLLSDRRRPSSNEEFLRLELQLNRK